MCSSISCRWYKHCCTHRFDAVVFFTGTIYAWYTRSSVVAPHLPVAPASMGSSSGFLPGRWTMVRTGLQGVHDPLGVVASIDSGMLSIANGSMLQSCGYDQQRVKIYEEFIYIYIMYSTHWVVQQTAHRLPHTIKGREYMSSLWLRISTVNILSYHILSLQRILSSPLSSLYSASFLAQHVSRLLYPRQPAGWHKPK